MNLSLCLFTLRHIAVYIHDYNLNLNQTDNVPPVAYLLEIDIIQHRYLRQVQLTVATLCYTTNPRKNIIQEILNCVERSKC